MKSISNFIIEKLNKINKSTIVKVEDYWYDEMEDVENMPEEFYNIRKSKKDNGTRNKPWYAVVVYLSTHGKATKDEIRQAVWPGKTGQQSELFAALTNLNITENVQRGYRNVAPFNKWEFNKRDRYGNGLI